MAKKQLFIDDLTVDKYLQWKVDRVPNSQIMVWHGYSPKNKNTIKKWKEKHNVNDRLINAYCHVQWDKKMNEQLAFIKDQRNKKVHYRTIAAKLNIPDKYFYDWCTKQVEAGRLTKLRRGRGFKSNKRITEEELDIAVINGIKRATAYSRVMIMGWDVERAITEQVDRSKVTNS